MIIEIRYISRSGNTKKIAEAIGETLDIQAKEATVPLPDHTDILILGGALYALHLDQAMNDFIASLDSDKVDRVYCFSTCAIMTSIYPVVKKALANKGILLEKLNYHCRGKFGALYVNRPNTPDIKRSKNFAKSIMSENNK